MERLLQGYREFRKKRLPEERARYEELASKGQKPEYLIIACSDSRSDPATIFNGRPGEFFVVRNVAAIVPPYEPDHRTHHGTSAAIAFAVISLGVRNILVMGHAQCGGVEAALNRKLAAGIPFLEDWIQLIEPAWAQSQDLADSAARHEAMERDCIRLSMQRLRSFPFVDERVAAGALAIHGARFGIADGTLEVLDRKTDRFVIVD